MLGFMHIIVALQMLEHNLNKCKFVVGQLLDAPAKLTGFLLGALAIKMIINPSLSPLACYNPCSSHTKSSPLEKKVVKTLEKNQCKRFRSIF
jgi:hypothetical protein